ncbi:MULTISPECIES: IucA/IucC family protein [Staphylococcus]|uniref:Siderophore synthetase component n=3 Tax=Staphylococcus TaxID=1279 RepID=A0ABY1H5Y2_9STAP|nr:MULTISPECIES: IucA/IucC family protein [Staphylococcus]ATH62099.1 siderophore synthetase [Staphylococcus pasteuri]KKI56426.1 Siderophore biosynthesis protein [Staphylococcus pasteuri]MCF7600291.1 siderophore synthetase [Staphylococcus pasteuri]MDI3231518.1 IucA/IucC family protein [Staphylococcus pasteuri]MDO6574400.1 IucA/IucC family protein [Staphylococcus pasteuri_A]
MERNEWLLADENIQHRILNAIIKEQICPEDAKINKSFENIELQYHGRVLTGRILRKSMLERYVFDGQFTYQCAEQKIQISNLEQLLKILNDQFDIKISDRLYRELIHSRDSFVETYKQFNNRKSLIHQSMKFSMLPDTINFFTWLQHLNANDTTDDLSYSESLVIEGHPTHPLTKTKLPLTKDEVRRYSPEFEKIIPLHIMLVSSSEMVTTSMEGDDQFIINNVIPELKDKIQHFLNPFDLSVDDYRAIFVHPWQYDHVIGDKFKTWISEKILIPTSFTVDSKATLSFRTMELLKRPFHVKLPVNVQATSAVRTVSTVTTVDGPKLSYALQDMLNIYPELKVAAEPFGEYINTDPDLARQLACIIREKPELNQVGSTIVSASLVNRNPVDLEVVVDSYIKWLDNELTKDNIERFMREYTRTLVKPLIAYIQDYGIALEAHMQNTIVNLGPDYQITFLVRDLGGSRIDIKTLQQKLPHIEITNESLIAENIEAVIAKFQHAVIQNQLAELIHHFNQYDFVNENILFKIVQQEVESAIDSNKNHAHALYQVLFGSTISVKALLSMRMENKVKKYLNTELDNPIKKEV